jgi:hypothetical protein
VESAIDKYGSSAAKVAEQLGYDGPGAMIGNIKDVFGDYLHDF